MLNKKVSVLLSCFMWTALVLALASCNFANSKVVTQTAEKEKTPTPDIAQSSIHMGIISGNLCYPSEGIPPMTIYARNVDTRMTYAIHVTATNKYEIEVPAENQYFVFGWSDAGAFTPDSLGGYYSCNGDFNGQMTYLGKGNLQLKCADADKEDHTPLRVSVRPNETTSEIHLCDWSNQELVPKP